jgi:hypothetical protein
LLCSKKLAKRGDIGYAYIIMIVLGILGIIFILVIFRSGIGELGTKILALGNQTQP